MFTFTNLKSIISLLEKNKINYYVFGGIALDGLRGSITREHSDLDLFIYEDDLEKFFEVMKSKKYTFTKRENMYFLDETNKNNKNNLKIGVLALTKEKNNYIVNGNKTLEVYPAEIFSKENQGEINKLKFSLAPNEVLAFESQYSKHPDDKKLGTELPCDKILFKKIKYTALRAPHKNN
jgi:phosphorylcholine metabolism protein LicD